MPIARTTAVLLFWLLQPAIAMGPLEYKGYLIDIYCYDVVAGGGKAIDGTDVIKEPWTHTVHCLRDLPQCRTYYLAENRGNGTTNDYRMKYVLDAEGNRRALDLLRATTRNANFTVTASGLHDGKGNLINATFEECFGDQCDGVCSGSCAQDSAEQVSMAVTANLWSAAKLMLAAWGAMLLR